MESVGLISEKKKRVDRFFLGHDSTNRPNAFTDLQDDACHADRGTVKEVWTASFLDKSENELLQELESALYRK